MVNFLSMGKETYRISLTMFQENRKKLVSELAKVEEDGLIVLLGGKSETRNDSDHEPVFRQESYFWYLCGVKEPDCALIIDTTNNAHTTLLIPKLPRDYATIMGRIKEKKEWKDDYSVDDVQYTEDLEKLLLEITEATATKKLLLLHGQNSDSGKFYDYYPRFQSTELTKIQDLTTLFPVLADCRVLKSQKELALLQHVTEISSFAHSYVMRNTTPAMMEYQLESLFTHYAYFNFGSRLVSYTSICGCGPNAAILHYGHAGEPNSREIEENDNCLLDMGAEYMCYASDITCSFPANGKFSSKYTPIYNAVLKAQIAVYDMAKPGVSWVDCHKAAERAILEDLATVGIVKVGHDDVTISDLVERRLGAVFMPHGLGHFIGIDTHDVGGYVKGPKRSPLPGLKSLRTARILEENMVLTVEPGCYFIDHLLDGALASPELSPYLNGELINKEYRGYGGVRLEDVVAITSDGLINFTLCPRTQLEIENVMAGGKWPPLEDNAPELRRTNLCKPIKYQLNGF